MPWNGYDPRSLTRVAKFLTFQAGMGRVNHEIISDAEEDTQLEVFPEGTHYGT